MKKLLIVLFVLFVSAMPCLADLYKVIRVVDGDTIDIDYMGKKERIRLLSVDTPESVHPDKTRNTLLGKQASDYTRKRLAGKSVFLEFEKKTRGRYGRLLAYVILDKQNFNLELVRKGWSPYYTKYGTSEHHHAEFISAQTRARASHLNIWKASSLQSIGVTSHVPGAAARKQVSAAGPFHGNTKTHKVHGPVCRYFSCSTCTRLFSSLNAAINAGYSPCRLCLP